MSLYVLGDTHLSLSSNKPMDVFGPRWENHEQKLIEGFANVKPEDTVVLAGDISWAMNLEAAAADFTFLDSLPGQKIVLKGNHDYWWSTTAKAYRFFNEYGITSIDILHNNFYPYGDSVAICGTRGWFYEEETGGAHDRKIMLREIGRLENSLKAAGDREKLVFLHYPPVYQSYSCSEILELLSAYRVKLCCYGHIHGKACYASFNGWYGPTEFKLTSADYLNFTPLKIMD